MVYKSLRVTLWHMSISTIFSLYARAAEIAQVGNLAGNDQYGIAVGRSLAPDVIGVCACPGSLPCLCSLALLSVSCCVCHCLLPCLSSGPSGTRVPLDPGYACFVIFVLGLEPFCATATAPGTACFAGTGLQYSPECAVRGPAARRRRSSRPAQGFP